MAVSGKYKIEMSTPMGAQSSDLELKAEGNSLSGIMTSPFGDQEFSDGSVNGDDMEWVINANSPMGPMKLEFTAKVSGDEISGTAVMGTMGSLPFTGTRMA